jgi:CheY-like chemotaxis protein
VLGIVRGHGGCLRVASGMGQGTTFELYFPASPEAKADTPPPRDTLPPRGHGEWILVVDDEPSMCALIRRALEDHNFKVMTAAEGAEALSLFAQKGDQFRVVITDMMMPGTDGPSLVRSLRRQKPHLPIIGMTGIGENTDVKGLAALDLVALLAKPFEVAVVLRAIQQALTEPAQSSPQKSGF